MPTGTLIGAGSLGSAFIGSSAARKAASQQAQAAAEARGMFAQARTDQMPYMRAGEGAVGSLAELYGIDPATGQRTGQPFNEASLAAFRNSPDYEFARREGLRGVEFSNAGRGLVKSGNNMRDLVQFSSGLATQNFGNYRGALQQLAQLGQSGATGAGTALAGMANQTNQMGAANASGTVGAANAWSGGLGQIGNYAMLQSLMGGGQFGGSNKGNLSAYATNNNLGYQMIPGWPGS